MIDTQTIREKDFEPWQNLAYAIVEQAAYDYRRELNTAKRQAAFRGRIMPMTATKINQIETFLRSDWMQDLAGEVVAGETIIRRIRKEVFRGGE